MSETETKKYLRPCPYPTCQSVDLAIVRDSLRLGWQVRCNQCQARGPVAMARSKDDTESDVQDRARALWGEEEAIVGEVENVVE